MKLLFPSIFEFVITSRFNYNIDELSYGNCVFIIFCTNTLSRIQDPYLSNVYILVVVVNGFNVFWGNESMRMHVYASDLYLIVCIHVIWFKLL